MGQLLISFVRLFVMLIIFRGVGASRGSRIFFLRTSCDPLGTLNEATGKRFEVLRYRLINEVRGSSAWENRAETSGFYGADFHSRTGISTEPVVPTRAPDVISA